MMPEEFPERKYAFDYFLDWLESDHFTAVTSRFLLKGLCCMMAIVFCVTAWYFFDADYFHELDVFQDDSL